MYWTFFLIRMARWKIYMQIVCIGLVCSMRTVDKQDDSKIGTYIVDTLTTTRFIQRTYSCICFIFNYDFSDSQLIKMNRGSCIHRHVYIYVCVCVCVLYIKCLTEKRIFVRLYEYWMIEWILFVQMIYCFKQDNSCQQHMCIPWGWVECDFAIQADRLNGPSTWRRIRLLAYGASKLNLEVRHAGYRLSIDS
jgi:hypothetical protein